MKESTPVSSVQWASLEEEASNAHVRRSHGDWSVADQAALERRLATDPAYAEAYRLADESVQLLRACAEMPEMMQFRERALAHARRSSINRWFGARPGAHRRWGIAAGFAAVLLALAAWQLSPWGFRQDQYRTTIAEQRTVELEDHSRMILDAATRVAVRYTGESRTIRLTEGQAQFSVAKDPLRPFRVQVGDHTIIALGTVFTVELTGQKIHVAMMEGRVAFVLPPSSAPSSARAEAPDVLASGKRNETGVRPSASSGNDRSRSQAPAMAATIELSAGEELWIRRNGEATVVPHADLEAATAWRNGKVVFRTERLGEAVRRMNRYSRLELRIDDPVLAEETVSGVFDAGDTQGFINGVQLALPVVADYVDARTVRLSISR
jgi:transmembrane sensor